MFLSRDIVHWSIAQLRESCHPFVGITFLACKKAGMPIGRTMNMSLDATTRRHLESHHRLDPRSKFYFQPCISNTFWVAKKYPSSGIQTINKRILKSIFIYPWGEKGGGGLVDEYADVISRIVGQAGGYAAPYLAALTIWTGKDERWTADSNLETVSERFLNEFAILENEMTCLFDVECRPPRSISVTSEEPLDLATLARGFMLPPDATSQTDGTLSSIRLTDVGPTDVFDFDFGGRLTLIVGDNGLGKSFLIDAAWWALTGSWAGRPAFPLGTPQATSPKVAYTMRDASGRQQSGEGEFDWHSYAWRDVPDRPPLSGLNIYAKVDGTIAISDEVRARLQRSGESSPSLFEAHSSPSLFNTHDVWDGKEGQIEGLMRDWVSWQLTSEPEPFSTLAHVLEHLSPDDIEPLTSGEPVRIPGDPRRIPTIKHFYGDVPVVVASEGVKRILVLAYLIIWMWHEHLLASRQVGATPQRKMVIVVDELEAHLHPRWQRLILPALMSVGRWLSSQMKVQIIATTHSPLVLASVEADFTESSDVLAHLSVVDHSVVLEPMEFYKYGEISSWLTSPVFGLPQARSRAAEQIIEEEKCLQLSSKPATNDVRETTFRLKNLLSPDDVFWSRWIYFAKQFGVNV